MGKAEANLAKWKHDPVSFVWDVFRQKPDPWQEDILRAFPHHQRLAMQACKGPGKTCLLSWLAWNFLLTRKESNIAVISITRENLMDGLWKELAKWRLRSPILVNSFEFTKTKIYAYTHPETWWISARSFAKDADAQGQKDSLAGLHMENIMILLDESGGIPPSVSATAEAILSSCEDGKIVQAGNPTDLSGALYTACITHRDKYFVVEITGDPDDPKRSPRISKDWARSQIEMYGRDNPWVLVNVFGKFPPSSLNSLIGVSDVIQAQQRRCDMKVVQESQARIGVDTARFGDDRTVITFRQGRLSELCCRPLRNADSREIADAVLRQLDQRGMCNIYVDDTGGYGGGVIDMLGIMGIAAIPVNFSSKADDPRYYNKRAEMWFRMAEWLKGGGVLADESDYRRELSAVTYSFQNDKLLLEDKKQIKKRLGYSPDLGDSLALTFAQAEMPHDPWAARFAAKGRRNVELNWDYDPFKDE